VAGTTTQYQPPFHRIIYLAAAGDSTPTTSCSKIGRVRSRSCAFGSPHRAARRVHSATCVHFSPSRAVAVGRVVLFRSFPELFPSSISCAKFGNVSRATSLNVSESFARARTTGERLLQTANPLIISIYSTARFDIANVFQAMKMIGIYSNWLSQLCISFLHRRSNYS